MPVSVSVAVLAPPSVSPPAPAITPGNVALLVWLTVKAGPPVLIVTVLTPDVGVAIDPESEPTVVGSLVERFRTTFFPGWPLFWLLTASGPVHAPKPDGPVAVTVPSLIVVPPE